jgi:hypothetical protein
VSRKDRDQSTVKKDERSQWTIRALLGHMITNNRAHHSPALRQPEMFALLRKCEIFVFGI